MALFSALTKLAACSVKGLAEARDGDTITNETAAEIVGSADDVIDEVLTASEQNVPKVDLRAIYRPVPQPLPDSDKAICELRYLIKNQFAIFDHDVDDPIRLEVRQLVLQMLCPAPEATPETLDEDTTQEQEPAEQDPPVVNLADALRPAFENVLAISDQTSELPAEETTVSSKGCAFSDMLTVTKAKPTTTGGRSRGAPPKPQAESKKPRAPRAKKSPVVDEAPNTSSATDDSNTDTQ